MKTGNISVFLCLFLVMIIPAVGKSGEQHSKYTLYRDDFEHAALIKISEIFSLIGEWDVYSVEGYTWQGAANGFDTYQQQNWIFMVNGQKMALKIFDIPNVNLLPISIGHIDSIEVFMYPQLVEDEYFDKGLIHIHTAETKEGITVQGQFTAGNKTGDPGPYRYTEYWSRNVDRIAADESYWLGYGGQQGFLGGGYYTGVYFPTDPRIVDRNRDIYPYENPRIVNNSFFIQSAFSQLISEPRIDIAYIKLEDFYFFKPLGREIPVNNYFTSVQLRGAVSLKNSFDLRYKLRYTSNDLIERKNAYDLDFDWKQQNIYANIYTRFILARQKINLGFALEQTKIETHYSLTRNIINAVKIYGSIIPMSDHYGHLKLDGAVDIDEEDFGYQLSGSGRWPLSKQFDVQSILSYSRTKVRTENSLWYWSEKGYDFVNQYGLGYSLDGNLEAGKQWSIDLIGQWQATKILYLNTGISYRSFLNKNWEIQLFQYDSRLYTVEAPVYIKTGQSGQVGSGFFKLKLNHSDVLSHNFYYRYSAGIGENNVFTQIWKTVPKHRFMYQIRFKPVDSFSIWVMLHYRSSVYWSDYAAIADQSEGKYTAHLSDVFLADIAINKWLWNKQIKLNFILRNLLNQTDISYPIGSSQDFRFYAQAELYFNFW